MQKVTIQEMFRYGLDREIPELLVPPAGEQINLGPGSKKFVGYLPAQSERVAAEVGLCDPSLSVMYAAERRTTGVGPSTNKLTDVQWIAPQRLPFSDSSIAAVHAYQFMEHLDSDTALYVLRDVERILMPGGVMFMATPYPGHGHYWQALDHKTHWTEETWDWLFGNEYYDHSGHPWQLRVHACFLMGVVYRNLNMLTQLVKPEI